MTYKSNLTEALPASSGSNWMLEVARRNLPGILHINKFGSNKDIDTGTTPEELWSAGGVWVPPTAARIHDIASTSIVDNSAGIGGRTLRISGLDSSWNLLKEDIVLNGTTNVSTANAYWRIHRMGILTSGSTNTNVGTISATAQTDATVTAEIDAGEGQSLMAIFTIPGGKTGYMTRAYATLDRTQTGTALCQMSLRTRSGIDTGDDTLRVAHVVSFATDGTSARSWLYLPYKIFEEKTDVFWRVDSVTANNAQVHGGFDLILVDN